MGQVYRAIDTKLKRPVAIKILPRSLAADHDRLARFQREAEMLASVNHPHIAGIYGLEESEGVSALVMELVDGEDVSQRIARGAIPIDEALPIAKQIAEALEAAHEQGIIHRDLKPANIKVRADGTVKVLDFGLAKAIEAGGPGQAGETGNLSMSPTLSRLRPGYGEAGATEVGMILGTAAYMAPEQAKGKPVDKRADIWAFGCVLYEMLAGRKAFAGEDVTDTLTAVMRDAPDWSALPATTPNAIRTLLKRSLEKDSRKRIPHIGVARIEIDEAMSATADLVSPAPSTSPTAKHSWGLIAGAAAAAALAAVITIAWPRTATTAVDAPLALRYAVDLPARAATVSVAVSPDGRFVAVSGRPYNGRMSQVWIRALDTEDFAIVPGSATAPGGGFPFWSPDSAELAFFVNRKLMRMRVAGGAPQEVADLSSILPTVAAGVPASWGTDGTILLSGRDGVYRLVVATGAFTKFIDDVAGEVRPNGYAWPQQVPALNGFLYSHMVVGLSDAGSLMFRRANATTSSTLLTTRSRSQFTKQGLLIARTADQPNFATLALHEFDAATGRLEMPGKVIASDASFEFSASNTGVLVYRRGIGAAPFRFEWLDATGQVTEEGFEVADPAPFNLSRDGTLLAYADGSGAVTVRDQTRGVGTRVVQGGAVEPILSPDGRRLAYGLTSTTPPTVVVQPSSGGTPEVVFKDSTATIPEDWSADGKFLAANQFNRGLIIALGTTDPPITYAQLPAGALVDETRFSPDGKWLLYNASDAGAQHEVYLIPLPPTGERWQLSVAGGVQGRWKADGRTVYYLALNGDLMRVDLELASGQRPRIGAPRKLFSSFVTASANIDQYAPNADGTKFLFRRRRTTEGVDRLNVIVNWQALLTRK